MIYAIIEQPPTCIGHNREYSMFGFFERRNWKLSQIVCNQTGNVHARGIGERCVWFHINTFLQFDVHFEIAEIKLIVENGRELTNFVAFQPFREKLPCAMLSDNCSERSAKYPIWPAKKCFSFYLKLFSEFSQFKSNLWLTRSLFLWPFYWQAALVSVRAVDGILKCPHRPLLAHQIICLYCKSNI